MNTIAGAEAGFAHSLMNQANPAARRATPLVRPPWRHKVTAPASIRDHPAAHPNTDVTGDDAAREKDGASQPSHAVPSADDHADRQDADDDDLKASRAAYHPHHRRTLETPCD